MPSEVGWRVSMYPAVSTEQPWAGRPSAMNINIAHRQLPCRGQVIALHASGADASQWRHLSEALGNGYAVLTPEHYGCKSSGPWTGKHAFTLADEAARTIALIDEGDDKVHLVGHSYGGGVALYVALSHPDRVSRLRLSHSPAVPFFLQTG